MELISVHHAIQHFQIPVGFLCLSVCTTLYLRRYLPISIFFGIEGTKNILNSIILIWNTGLGEKYYCCIDMAFSFAQFVYLVLVLYQFNEGKDLMKTTTMNQIISAELKSSSLFYSFNVFVLLNLSFVYFIALGLSMVPKHDYLPMPGLLIGMGLIGITSYIFYDFENEIHKQLYFISRMSCYLFLLSLCILHHYISYQNALFFVDVLLIIFNLIWEKYGKFLYGYK
jgi:hypothetical protein